MQGAPSPSLLGKKSLETVRRLAHAHHIQYLVSFQNLFAANRKPLGVIMKRLCFVFKPIEFNYTEFGYNILEVRAQ
jgi:hypothetical protein